MNHIDLLSNGYSGTSLCSLHRPCCVERKCLMDNKKEVFDFDRITRDYRQRKGWASCASVDAITKHGATLYLVEMKGWKEFLVHTSRISEQKIQKQADKYNLGHKLADSLSTCIGLLHEVDREAEETFSIVPKCYVIVTDILPQENPLVSIVGNLNLLAQTSSNWEIVCWKHLKERANLIKGMKTLFVPCRSFDSLFV